MNLSEINWDPNAAGAWPIPIQATAIALVCSLVFSAGIYYDTLDQLAALDISKKKELELKLSFEAKQKKAINLEDYQDQLEQIESQLDDMIKQMPTKEEVASLLIDISKTGLASGLEFRLFKPGAPARKDFYSELPINIEVIGKYDELGLFVSGLASLPRIVTIHDVNIIPEGKESKEGKMKMTATIKTYNEGSDESPTTAIKKKRGQK